MLVSIDESGDLGFKLDRGSTRFFTIALVVFENGEAALACQRGIEALHGDLHLPPRHEFHFHEDTHQRRLAFLSVVARFAFDCYTFTLGRRIKAVKISRSSSDPLLQLADYAASATNRLYEGKPGAESYDALLRRKRRSQRLWP